MEIMPVPVAVNVHVHVTVHEYIMVHVEIAPNRRRLRSNMRVIVPDAAVVGAVDDNGMLLHGRVLDWRTSRLGSWSGLGMPAALWALLRVEQRQDNEPRCEVKPELGEA